MRPEATVVCGLTATAVIQDSLSNGTLFVAQLSAELSATRLQRPRDYSRATGRSHVGQVCWTSVTETRVTTLHIQIYIGNKIT